ncbi:MAG TPA: MBL fold metallo-hydrolase [Blastocatellia bacterium]|nr:MBL fold metallo-hydrolase [Blastocatellia bacterium]
MTKLHFLGAAGTVTGSKFVLECDGYRVMIDCGLFQGLKELRLRNWEPLPLHPASINDVVLTHAHIDHTGYLPRLVREGFHGTVYATKATADLLTLMLPDSARIQQEDAEYANRKGFSKHKPALPLYTESDAKAALRLLQGVNYEQDIRLSKFVNASFTQAGHILGSGCVKAHVHTPDSDPFSILFSGDLGRYDEPILNDPAPVHETDYLLIESTYGNRTHENIDPKDRLAEIINETVTRGGKVIIPAFAIGRTQLLVYYLRELEDEKRIPIIPVIVDSPMGASATKFYMKHKQEHDLDMQTLAEDKRNALSTHRFQLVHGREGSKGLNKLHEPAVIISASGMATGGRILHHLYHNLPNPRNTVVLVGYQAEGTRGRRLQNGEKTLRLLGEEVPVNAKIETVGSLSAHADSSEILRWLREFKRPPRKTFIVHGEPDAATALGKLITDKLGWEIAIPQYQEVVNLG